MDKFTDQHFIELLALMRAYRKSTGNFPVKIKMSYEYYSKFHDWFLENTGMKADFEFFGIPIERFSIEHIQLIGSEDNKCEHQWIKDRSGLIDTCLKCGAERA